MATIDKPTDSNRAAPEDYTPSLGGQGHGKPCAMCTRACDMFAGNPGKWPLVLVPTWRADYEPGKPEVHCTSCVMQCLAVLRQLTEVTDGPPYRTRPEIETVIARARDLIGGETREPPPAAGKPLLTCAGCDTTEGLATMGDKSFCGECCPQAHCPNCLTSTGGVCRKHQEPECTCYEVTGGHMVGCAFNRAPEPIILGTTVVDGEVVNVEAPREERPAAPLGGALLTPVEHVPGCQCERCELGRLRSALEDCGTSPDNPDTCGVCGEHFAECEQDRRGVWRDGDGEMPSGNEPGCPGARARAALKGETRAARRERVWKKHLAGELMTLDKFLEARGWFYSHAKWCDMCAAATTPPINCCHVGANAAGADHENARIRKELDRARLDRDHWYRIVHGYGADPEPRVWHLSSMMGGWFEWTSEKEIRAKYENDPDVAISGYVPARTASETAKDIIRQLLIKTVGQCTHGIPDTVDKLTEDLEAGRCTEPAVYGILSGWACPAHRGERHNNIIGGELTKRAMALLYGEDK